MIAARFDAFSASSRLCVSLIVGLLLVARLHAAPPTWWTDSSSETPTAIIDSSSNADHSVSANYEPANLGQLKNVAKQARLYLEAQLPGGAGGEITAMVSGFSRDPAVNYAPINLGQLKAVAKPFYDRLLSAGCDTRANLIAHGYPGGSSPWAFYYPWNPDTPVSENYAPSNIGQLKMVFSFDVSSVAANVLGDFDNDGLPDWWETVVAGGTSGGALSDWNNDRIKNVTELVASSGNGCLPFVDISPVEMELFTLFH